MPLVDLPAPLLRDPYQMEWSWWASLYAGGDAGVDGGCHLDLGCAAEKRLVDH